MGAREARRHSQAALADRVDDAALVGGLGVSVLLDDARRADWGTKHGQVEDGDPGLADHDEVGASPRDLQLARRQGEDLRHRQGLCRCDFWSHRRGLPRVSRPRDLRHDLGRGRQHGGRPVVHRRQCDLQTVAVAAPVRAVEAQLDVAALRVQVVDGVADRPLQHRPGADEASRPGGRASVLVDGPPQFASRRGGDVGMVAEEVLAVRGILQPRQLAQAADAPLPSRIIGAEEDLGRPHPPHDGGVIGLTAAFQHFVLEQACQGVAAEGVEILPRERQQRQTDLDLAACGVGDRGLEFGQVEAAQWHLQPGRDDGMTDDGSCIREILERHRRLFARRRWLPSHGGGSAEDASGADGQAGVTHGSHRA